MIHLVLGGARSGKSRLAEQTAMAHSQEGSLEVTYVATATAGDSEMATRIEHHQRSRPLDWNLIEEPKFLSKCIATIDSSHVILIDCLTLWLSNWLCCEENLDWDKEKQSFLKILAASDKNIILVSNEVGSGIVPLGELSRQFADEAGWLNQAIAEIADKVTLVVAGCPLILKERNLNEQNLNESSSKNKNKL